jgi:hypothetical protein
LSAGLGYKPNRATEEHFFKSQIVDNAPTAPQGLGKLAAAAIDALEMAAAGPARKTHDDVLRANTGWELDPVLWAKRAAASRQLTAQTERIVSALSRSGVDVVRPGDVTLISAVTGIVESLPIYRAVRFLPTIAARDRRPMINGLKLYMAGHRQSKYFRYAVMTCAEPIPAFGDLRGTIQELSRRISKWAHRVQKYGIKVLFRGIEFTRATAAERGMADRYPAETPLYHVHANVIYWPTRALKATEWEAFLRETRGFMNAEWKDNGKIGRVEEIVKYCSKPNDTLAASDDELVWLYLETQRLKIAQPMGEFKLWLKDIEERGEKIVRVQVHAGDGRLMRVQKQKRASAREGSFEAREDSANETHDDVNPPERVEREKRSSDGPPANVVLGMSLPQWRHSPWAEPMIMVQHYDPTRLSLEDGGDIRAWQAQARAWWDDTFAPPPEEALRIARLAIESEMSNEDIREAAEAACYILDTCRPTVQPDDIEELDEEEVEEVDEDWIEFETILGAKLIKFVPRPRTEDDEIPYETPEQARRRAEDAAWRERMSRPDYHSFDSSNDSCRIAA